MLGGYEACIDGEYDISKGPKAKVRQRDWLTSELCDPSVENMVRTAL